MVSSRTVLANGCFDPFHYGHLLHLQAARKLGDRLIVSVTRNEKVNKGPWRPVFDEEERAAVLRELRCVDEVILVNGAMEALIRVRPAVFVKGAEYEDQIQPAHREFCEQYGIEIAFTREKKYSSTKLLRHYDRSGQG